MDPEVLKSDEFFDIFMKKLLENVENHLKEIYEKVIVYCEIYKSTRDVSYFKEIDEGTKEYFELADGMKSVCNPSKDLETWIVHKKLILCLGCLESLKSIRCFDNNAETYCKIWEDTLKAFNIV